jgi:hypothetical protein
MRKLIVILVAPVLSLSLLGGIALQNRRYVKPTDTEAYHARAKAALDAVPYRVGDWVGQDQEIPTAAIKLLRPNAIISRRYLDTSPAGYSASRAADLLIVQTRESRDMQGHYPLNCYVSSGMTVMSQVRRTWQIGELSVPGTMYEFTQRLPNRVSHTFVYNFLLVPGPIGLVPDIAGVNKAAEDYQQRYYGAAQFQVVFSSVMGNELPQEQRDQIFQTLVGANTSVIKALLAGGIK